MQRLLFFILLLCSAAAVRAQSVSGDMDADRRLTATDVQRLAQAITHRAPDATALLRGDMNGDGLLSIRDLALLIDAALRFKEPGYPLPYESAAVSEDDWLVVNGQTGTYNPWIKGTSYVQATGYQAWNGSTKKSNHEVDGYLISPAFCTQSSTGSVTMSFDDVLRYTNNDPAYAQHVKIYASTTSDGTAFVPSEWTELDWTVSHVNNSSWTLVNTDIALPAEFVNKEYVRIAFWFYAPADGSTTFEFNNFRLYESEGDGGTVTPDPPTDPDDLNSNTVSLAGSYVNTETNVSSSAFIGRLEMPRLCGDDTFIVHQDTELSGSPVNYSIAYNEAKRHSHWVAFRFDSEIGKKTISRSGNFKRDPLIDKELQVPTAYPKGSGYDRGHMASSNDRTATETSNVQTFYMTNMSPQLSSFNQVYWQKYENHLISLVRTSTNTVPTTFRAEFADTVYVVKGGTIRDDQLNGYLTMTDGFDEPVPAYYYMALLKVKNGQYSAIGFWMEHKEYPSIDSKKNKEEIRAHCVTIDELERLTGIDFFCNLPASIEATVEQVYSAADWELE